MRFAREKISTKTEAINKLFLSPFGYTLPFAILLRQGYEGTGYEGTSFRLCSNYDGQVGGQAGLRLIKGKLFRMDTNLK